MSWSFMFRGGLGAGNEIIKWRGSIATSLPACEAELTRGCQVRMERFLRREVWALGRKWIKPSLPFLKDFLLKAKALNQAQISKKPAIWTLQKKSN